MRLLLLLLAAEGVGLGCWCLGSGSVCAQARGSEAMFVGRAMTDSGPEWGRRAVKVRVEEALRNVPAGLGEMEIDSSFGTTCYGRLEAGKRYVIFAWRQDGTWKTNVCAGNFEVAGHEHMLNALREAARGGESRIVGRVARRTGPYASGAGVGGARVVARSEGRSYEALTDGAGVYELRGVEPGRYRFEVTKAGFAADESDQKTWNGRLVRNAATGVIGPEEADRGSVVVSEGGCEVWDLGLWADGRIAGTVRGSEGKAVAGVEVRVYPFDEKGKRESQALRTGVTDGEGRYEVKPLPAGEYVVGVNADLYRDNDAYAPVEYGSRIRLEEGGERPGVDLQVGAKRRALRLRVQVLDAEGRPRAGAGMKLENLAGTERWFGREHTDREGWMEVPVWEGESYVVKAWYFELGRRGTRVDEQGEVPYNAAAGDGEVTVVLKAVKQ